MAGYSDGYDAGYNNNSTAYAVYNDGYGGIEPMAEYTHPDMTYWGTGSVGGTAGSEGHTGYGQLRLSKQAEGPLVPLATVGANPRHKREVCTYWLQSKCQKGDACEFLHQMDYSKMPSCPLGDTCDADDCPFKHASADRPECANYQLGFCSFGRKCPHRHVERHAGWLPDVSPYWLTGSPTASGATSGPQEYAAVPYAALKRQADRNWRTRVCDYFAANGWCPYFDMCNFAHGEPLRSAQPRPQGSKHGGRHDSRGGHHHGGRGGHRDSRGGRGGHHTSDAGLR